MSPLPPRPLDDAALVRLAQLGCEPAFAELVGRHQERVYHQALGLMKNPTDAADALQDTLLSAWRNLDRFRGDASFSSWLYRICHNACLMKMRTRRRRPEVALDLRADDGEDWLERALPDDGPGPDAGLDGDELAGVIAEAVETLPPIYREVFDHAYVARLPLKDIAVALDLSEPNVKTRLHRARLKLRERLQPYVDGDPALSRAA